MTTLDLNGVNVTLPDGTVFTTTYLTGSNNVTNNGNANATLTEGGGPAATTYSGTISDGSTHTTSITQTSGFVDFTGTNSYSGNTNLQGGTIGVGSNSALGSGTLVMSTGTTVQADAATVTVSNNTTASGSITLDTNGNTLTWFGYISGTGPLTKIGAGTLGLYGINNNYSGAINLNAGTLAVSSISSLGSGPLNMSSGTTLQFQGSPVLGNALTLAGSDTIDLTQQSPTLSGLISGTGSLSVISAGGANLTLSDSNNNYSGGTTIAGASVTITADRDLGATSGGITLGSASSWGTLIFAANVSLSASRTVTLVANNSEVPETLEVSSGTATVSSVITGSGGLNVAGGTLVLDGNNSGYTGQTTLSTGTLVIGNQNALGTNALYMIAGTTLQAGASGLMLPNGISLQGSDTIDTNGNTLTMASNFFQSGSPGGLVKVGAGKLVLDNANNNYTGGTVLEAGTLELAVFNNVNAAIATGVTFTAAGATLQLDGGTSQLGGVIAGAATGDNIGLDFLTYAAGDHAVWTPNGGNGTLAVETAANATLASLTLSGSYSTSDFTVESDNQNHVVVILGAGLLLNTNNPSVSYAGGNSPVVLDSTLSITDSNSNTLASATVQITGGTFSGDGDILNTSTTGTAITSSYSSSTETLTLSGTDTLADYQAVLRQVTFATANTNATNSGADPSRTVNWTVTDGAINSSPVSTVVSVGNVVIPPAIAINSVDGSNVINATEAAAGVTISGSESRADGLTVTVKLLNSSSAVVDTYSATAAGSAWSVNVTAAQAQALADGSYTVTANVSDQYGNAALQASQAVTVHETFPSIAINPVDGNNIITTAEAAAGVTIGGTESNADGQTVTVDLLNSSSTVVDSYTATAAAGAWSVSVTAGQAQALGDGSYTVTANASDQYGNPASQAAEVVSVIPSVSGNVDEWLLSNGQWAASAEPGSHPSGYSVAGVGDFTGSGTDGILWYDASTGDTDEWKINYGAWAGSVDLGAHPGNFQIAGVGDFTGNGTDDVLWTSSSNGQVQTDIWELSGGQWAASVSPGSHPAGYQVAGIGDFTGNGTDDILWQNPTTGDVDEWQLSNGQWAASVDLGAHPGSGWQIAGVGDFTGNGISDILWTNSGNGQVQTDIWELGSNGQWVASVSPGSHPAGYQVAGIGDFTGNGTSDILWQNSATGDIDEWRIAGGKWSASVDLGAHPGNTPVSGVGNFTGNGTSDILFHTSS